MSPDGLVADGLSVLCALLAVVAASMVTRSIDAATGDRAPGWVYGVVIACAGFAGFLLGGYL